MPAHVYIHAWCEPCTPYIHMYICIHKFLNQAPNLKHCTMAAPVACQGPVEGLLARMLLLLGYTQCFLLIWRQYGLLVFLLLLRAAGKLVTRGRSCQSFQHLLAHAADDS